MSYYNNIWHDHEKYQESQAVFLAVAEMIQQNAIYKKDKCTTKIVIIFLKDR